MTYQEVIAMVEEMGLPYAYDHFAEGESPEPPFLVFLFPRSNNFSADGKVYQKINQLQLELYTDRKQPNLEKRVEVVLDSHDLFYDKSEVWIPDEKLYELLYTTEIIYEEDN